MTRAVKLESSPFADNIQIKGRNNRCTIKLYNKNLWNLILVFKSYIRHVGLEVTNTKPQLEVLFDF